MKFQKMKFSKLKWKFEMKWKFPKMHPQYPKVVMPFSYISNECQEGSYNQGFVNQNWMTLKMKI